MIPFFLYYKYNNKNTSDTQTEKQNTSDKMAANQQFIPDPEMYSLFLEQQADQLRKKIDALKKIHALKKELEELERSAVDATVETTMAEDTPDNEGEQPGQDEIQQVLDYLKNHPNQAAYVHALVNISRQRDGTLTLENLQRWLASKYSRETGVVFTLAVDAAKLGWDPESGKAGVVSYGDLKQNIPKKKKGTGPVREVKKAAGGSKTDDPVEVDSVKAAGGSKTDDPVEVDSVKAAGGSKTDDPVGDDSVEDDSVEENSWIRVVRKNQDQVTKVLPEANKQTPKKQTRENLQHGIETSPGFRKVIETCFRIFRRAYDEDRPVHEVAKLMWKGGRPLDPDVLEFAAELYSQYGEDVLDLKKLQWRVEGATSGRKHAETMLKTRPRSHVGGQENRVATLKRNEERLKKQLAESMARIPEFWMD